MTKYREEKLSNTKFLEEPGIDDNNRFQQAQANAYIDRFSVIDINLNNNNKVHENKHKTFSAQFNGENKQIKELYFSHGNGDNFEYSRVTFENGVATIKEFDKRGNLKEYSAECKNGIKLEESSHTHSREQIAINAIEKLKSHAHKIQKANELIQVSDNKKTVTTLDGNTTNVTVIDTNTGRHISKKKIIDNRDTNGETISYIEELKHDDNGRIIEAINAKAVKNKFSDTPKIDFNVEHFEKSILKSRYTENDSGTYQLAHRDRNSGEVTLLEGIDKDIQHQNQFFYKNGSSKLLTEINNTLYNAHTNKGKVLSVTSDGTNIDFDNHSISAEDGTKIDIGEDNSMDSISKIKDDSMEISKVGDRRLSARNFTTNNNNRTLNVKDGKRNKKWGQRKILNQMQKSGRKLFTKGNIKIIEARKTFSAFIK